MSKTTHMDSVLSSTLHTARQCSTRHIARSQYVQLPRSPRAMTRKKCVLQYPCDRKTHEWSRLAYMIKFATNNTNNNIFFNHCNLFTQYVNTHTNLGPRKDGTAIVVRRNSRVTFITTYASYGKTKTRSFLSFNFSSVAFRANHQSFYSEVSMQQRSFRISEGNIMPPSSKTHYLSFEIKIRQPRTTGNLHKANTKQNGRGQQPGTVAIYWTARPLWIHFSHLYGRPSASYFRPPERIEAANATISALLDSGILIPLSTAPHRDIYNHLISRHFQCGRTEIARPELDWPSIWKWAAKHRGRKGELVWDFSYNQLQARLRQTRLHNSDDGRCFIIQHRVWNQQPPHASLPCSSRPIHLAPHPTRMQTSTIGELEILWETLGPSSLSRISST